MKIKLRYFLIAAAVLVCALNAPDECKRPADYVIFKGC